MADYSSAVRNVQGRNGEIVVTNDGVRTEKLFLEIGNDGKEKAHLSWRFQGDGVTFDEYYGVSRAYMIADARTRSLAISAEALRRDLKDGGKLAILIDRILAGLSVEIGEHGNSVGVLDEDAEEAEEKLEKALAADYSGSFAYVDETKRVCTPWEWLFSSEQTDREMLLSIGLEASSYDVEVEAAAIKVRADAEESGDIIVGDLKLEIMEALERLREEEAS